MEAFKDFDLQSAPLQGTSLIEASAGTGKSFSIASLFLRLVLEKGIPVHEILVVTFTEAATEELRDRIRRRLGDALGVLRGEPCEEELLRRLLTGGGAPEDAARRLKQALGDFDRASIMTIHGFCRRVLKESAFESSSPLELELLTSQDLLKREVVEDYWRKSLYAESPLFVRYALQEGFLPDRLLALLGSRSSQPFLRIVPAEGPVDAAEEERAFLASVGKLRSAWPSACEEVSRLLTGDALKKTCYATAKIPSWVEGMSAFLSCSGAELFPAFAKFTTCELERSAKKGCAAPAHPVFDLCEEVQRQRDALLAAYGKKMLRLKAELFRCAAETLAARKRKKGVLYYDDLLLNLYSALQGRAGKALVGAVREKYKAALIDEFQDTDPLQYAIFRELFASGEEILFLIGDPKQSIYGFRGADLFAYMEAARGIGRRFTLRENWRSAPGLIRAVNALFEGHPLPFVYESIRYHPSLPAPSASTSTLRVEGEPESPFRLWVMEGDSPESREIPKAEARDLICAAVSGEIGWLLRLGREGKALLDGRPLREEDIAVLVRRNQEAARMQQILSRLRIPSVIYGTGNLFASREAEELERILCAVAAPENGRLLRAALSTDILAQKAEDLERLMTDESGWEGWLMRFRQYLELWLSRGFARMFRLFLRQEKVLGRLMGFPDGERRCTNLLHLSELLHQASTDMRLNRSALLQWLAMQRSGGGSEEHPIRLESDERAVKLITVHKSKGLEFPVVFCPFGWDGSEVRNAREPFVFHAGETTAGLTLDLGSEEMEENRRLAERELLSENLRLLYVSLTRARARTYFVWGRFKSAGTSAPAYLLRPSGSMGDPWPAGEEGGGRQGQGDAFRGNLEGLSRRAGEAIVVDRIQGKGREAPPLPPSTEQTDFSCRTFRGRVERDWGVASFSSLTSLHPRAAEPTDRDQAEMPPPPMREREAPRGFFSFPAGVRTGGFLHGLFEELDFTIRDATARRALVREKLLEYGFDPVWEDGVDAMLDRVLNAELDPGSPALRLCRVKAEDRLNELEFYFPLKRITSERLREVLVEFGAADGLPPEFAENIGGLVFSPVRGYMRGFIDLLFRHEGRYFVVDWKSHDLGPVVEDYGPGELARAMREGVYTFQALIYAVAAHRYLKLRLGGYRFDAHFGGIFYLFVRGVDPAGDHGICRIRPSEALLERLAAELIDG